MSFDSFLDPNKPDDVQVLLHKLAPYRGKGKRVCDLPSKYRNYRQHNFFGPQFKPMAEFRTICDVAKKIQAHANTPDSYARDWNAVLFIVGMHYPTADDNERPMSLDRDGFFSQPSIARVIYVWIGILEDSDFAREIAICLVMSSVLIFDLLPITGPATWAKDAQKDAKSSYWYALKETRVASTTLLHRVIRSCPNLIGLFTVGQKAFEDFPGMLENTGTTVINDDCVVHGCVLSGGKADDYQRAVFLQQSAKCVSRLTGTPALQLDNKLIHVAPSKSTGKAVPWCKIVDCMRFARSNGRCTIHGGRIFCSHGLCTNIIVQGGLCMSHGAVRNHRKHTVKKKCQYAGGGVCSSQAQKGGLCYRHGDSSNVMPKRERTRSITPTNETGEVRSVSPTDEVVARKSPPELSGLKRTLDEVGMPELGD